MTIQEFRKIYGDIVTQKRERILYSDGSKSSHNEWVYKRIDIEDFIQMFEDMKMEMHDKKFIKKGKIE